MSKSFLNLLILIILSSGCGTGAGSSSTSAGDDGINDGQHRIFATSVTFTGNLGGLAGADAKCNQVAQSAGLKRSYMAILSDTNTSALDRLNIPGQIVAVDLEGNQLEVAASGDDLWNTDTTQLQRAVNLDETGYQVSATPWTGTTSTGNSTSHNCTNWSSSSEFSEGDYGDTSARNSSWLERNWEPCHRKNAIYCISK